MRQVRARTTVERLADALTATGHAYHRFETVPATRMGVSPRELHCLHAVAAAGSLDSKSLREAVGVTSGGMTGIVEHLGLLDRAAEGAARRVLAEISRLPEP